MALATVLAAVAAILLALNRRRLQWRVRNLEDANEKLKAAVTEVSLRVPADDPLDDIDIELR
ncbi:MAG: hypothetical protein N3A57_00435 [Negativicutes bacterium]|nr:hypothetical protein [Negativicutes bacterium]